MDTVKYFKEHKYVHLKNFLPKISCDELTFELKTLVKKHNTIEDLQCPKSKAIHGAIVFDKLLEYCLPYFEKASGLELYPTYSYARLYFPNEELLPHVDRDACEISATITLGFDGNVWEFYVADESDETGILVDTFPTGQKHIKNIEKVTMDIGDAVLYRGIEKYHWREEYLEGKWQAQVFLHYVDKNGQHAEWKNDKRDSLGISKTDPVPNENVNIKTFDVSYTIPNAISNGFCDNIIKEYSKKEVEKELPYIGDGVVDLSIRNVQRVMLPMHAGIGGTLTSIGLNLNNDFWQFNITHSNQTEFLMYEVGGKYDEHTDAEHKHSKETRKLTVLAILNDDFEGGKFFIKNGKDKIYPKQGKGDVIVFPSFMLHGVESITKGVRYSVVTWMVGEYFK